MTVLIFEDICDCTSCKGEEHACRMDCDRDSECRGCEERRLEREETLFEIDCQTGRR